MNEITAWRLLFTDLSPESRFFSMKIIITRVCKVLES